MNNLAKFSRAKELQVFYKTLNDRVHQYFKEAKTERTGNVHLYAKTLIMLALYLGPYIMIMTTALAPWAQWILCVLMGVGMAGVGMNVMHDGNHGSYSSNPLINNIMGGSMYLLSGNASNWKVQHNMLHHTYTNVYGYDEDLDAGRILRFSNHAEWSWFHRFQHFYCILLYGLLTLNWLIITDFMQTIRYGKLGFFGKDYNMTMHWIRLIFSKILYYAIWIIVPVMFLENPWWQILIGFLSIHYTAGLILSVIFQLAHVSDDPETMLPSEENLSKNSWAMHQLYTTVNFGTKSSFLNWYLGGLNHQIEHHLFPNISHVHYSRISKIVKKTAKEFSLPYYEYKTMWQAFISHMRHLKSLSKKPETNLVAS